MTQPATQQQPPASSPDALAGQTPSEQKIILGVAGLLAVGAAYDATVKGMLAVMAPLGLPVAAIRTATRVAMSAPVGDQPPPGTPVRGSGMTTARVERTFRATYLVAAAKRIARLLREGKQPLEIIRAERNAFNRHLQAQGRRREMARKIDATAAKYGPTLGWYAKMDARTSAECRWANGRNFEVDKRPPIGYPGTVHPNCRCTPGPPHANGKSVYPVRKARAQKVG